MMGIEIWLPLSLSTGIRHLSTEGFLKLKRSRDMIFKSNTAFFINLTDFVRPGTTSFTGSKVFKRRVKELNSSQFFFGV